MKRRPRPYLALVPPTMAAPAAREVLAASQRAAVRSGIAGGAVVGLLAGLGDDPLLVLGTAGVLVGAVLFGAGRGARLRAQAGVVLLTDEEWDLVLSVHGARLEGRLGDDVVPKTGALFDAVRRGAQPDVDRATADLRALAP